MRGRLRYGECEHADFEPIRMRACQHRQSRQRQQPPPTLTKHSTPKVAGNSPLPISCDEIISLKFRHFQHTIEHSIIELHAKLQGAHRTTVPHSATSSARASPHSNSQRLDTHMELPQHARTHKTAPASSLDEAGTRPGPGLGSRAQSPTDVQLRPRILPVRVRRHPAAATARVMRPRNQKAGCIGGR